MSAGRSVGGATKPLRDRPIGGARADLAHSYHDATRTLVYIYWEPENNDEALFREHRAEIERFAALVAGDETCSFVALSYAEHWSELKRLADPPAWLREHLRLLRLRYAVAI
jgi:hypothetical protein